jgi:hypothetical protein
MTDVTYISGLTGNSQIVPVTIFLVMLYNACFMFQNNNETNLLTMALDTLDLNADVDHDKFMSTMSEYNNLRQIPFPKNSFEKILRKVFFISLNQLRCTVVVYF